MRLLSHCLPSFFILKIFPSLCRRMIQTQKTCMADTCTLAFFPVLVFVSVLHIECRLQALLHSSVSFPVRQICLFVSIYVFEWQYVWHVSCCWIPRLVKGRKNGAVFASTLMAAVHFSPELLSEQPVTLLMINASVRRAVSELRQPLRPDSWRNLRPPAAARPSP